MQKYGKAIVAFLGLVAVFIVNARGGGITPVEWAQAGTVAVGAVAVYGVPLFPEFPMLKTMVGLAATLAAVLVGLLGDGWSGSDAGALIGEVLMFLGIPLASARSDRTGVSVPLGLGSARTIDGTFTPRTGPIH